MTDRSDNRLLWLRLVLTPGLGPVQAGRLLERFGSVEGIFAASAHELNEVKGVRGKVAELILADGTRAAAEAELVKCEELGVKVVALDDPGYPRPLLEIPSPPTVLYILGEWREADEDAVAMVGCRNPDAYGESMAMSLASGLARYGMTVVSGMARGIDGFCHEAALKAGGRTVAVLGTGVDVPYPGEHRDLYGRIRENGAVMSEFPLGAAPEPGNFPRRNRIISGLARGVIMVQALTEKSGALITVRHAVEHNREVFAVPGNAGSKGGRVGNLLIKQGAKLVETAEDVLIHLRPLTDPSVAVTAESAAEEKPARRKLPGALESVYSLVPAANEGTVDIDALARMSGLGPAEASAALLELELAGLIRALPGRRFVRLGD